MRNHQIAVWAGVASFFATLLAIGTIDLFNPSDQLRLLSGIVVGLITGGAVYSKQRLDDAKQAIIHAGTIRIKDIGDKQVFTLELKDDPIIFKDKQKVTFEVDARVDVPKAEDA